MARSSHAKVALLLNVRSGKARKEPALVDRIEAAFGDRGPFFLSKNPSELPNALADIHRARPKVLFICGGDGTLRQTLTHLLKTYRHDPYPQVAILRGGTMNTVALSLGISRPPLAQLQSILHRIDRGLPLALVERNLLAVNGHHGFIFGVGGFSRFIEQYNAHPDPSPAFGLSLVTHTVLSSLMGGSFSSTMFKRFRVSLWRDRQPWLTNTRVTNVAASAIAHIGFGFKPFYGAEVPGGGFGLLVFTGPPRKILFHLPRFYRGEAVSDPEILQLPAKDSLLKLDTPMRPMLDGDLLAAEKEFHLKSGPTLEWVVG